MGIHIAALAECWIDRVRGGGTCLVVPLDEELVAAANAAIDAARSANAGPDSEPRITLEGVAALSLGGVDAGDAGETPRRDPHTNDPS